MTRSGTIPTGSVNPAPAVQATSLGVPGSISTAVLPGRQAFIAKATDEHVSALSSPAEYPESSPSALCGSSSAQRLEFPMHKATFREHQPQNGGSSMPSSEQHAARGAQALSASPAAPEEETWQEVRSGRRKLAARPTAAKAGKPAAKAGKRRSGGQKVPEALPKPAAAPTTSQGSQRLQAHSESAACPKLPKPGPTQAEIGKAAPQCFAIHASSQRQPAQNPLHGAPAAVHRWAALQASARPQPERMSEPPDLAAVEFPQQNHKALLQDLLLQPKASSLGTRQHMVNSSSKKALPVVRHCKFQASTSLQSAVWTTARSLLLLAADCQLVALTWVRVHILRTDTKLCK